MLDHLSRPPEIHPISHIKIPEVTKYDSVQDIPVYIIEKSGSEVVMIELVFKAGRPFEHKKLVAASCASLMRQGAGKYNAVQLSEEIDYLGATISTKSSMDYISIKAVCRKQQFTSLLDLLQAIISSPHYEQEELDLYVQQSITRLQVQLAKPDIKSYRTITEAIYGKDHPYGYNSSQVAYQQLNTADLRDHHKKYIHAGCCNVFVAGDVSQDIRKDLDSLCASIPQVKSWSPPKLPASGTSPSSLHLPGGQHQASIRIGRKAITRMHDDFYGLNYLCNLLGGYQGSRLVSELRESRGLTYGIYSMMDVLAHDADLMISTEVALDKVEESLSAIYEQMNLLSKELVPKDELQLVDNYLLGNYLNLFDGPFNSIRGIKSLVLAGFPLDMLDTLIESSVGFDAEYLRQIAGKYFKRNDFWEVIVGQPV